LKRLLILDCDGTLVDSEPASNRALHAWVRQLGLDISLEESTRMLTGLSVSTTGEILRERGLELPADWEQQIHDCEIRAVSHGIKPVTGIENVLANAVGFGYQLATATNAPAAKAQTSLPASGLAAKFPQLLENLFSAEQVARPKPAPDLLHLVCETLQVPPEECILLEDSLAGIRAGAEAGIQTFGLVGHVSRTMIQHAGAIPVESFREVIPVLRSHRQLHIEA